MVNPISFGPSGINSQADFSPLAQLGQIYQKAQQDQANKAAFAAYQQTGDPGALLGSGDMNLAQLGMNAQRHADVLKQQIVENKRADANLALNQAQGTRAAAAETRAAAADVRKTAEDENKPYQYIKNPLFGKQPGEPEYIDQYATIKANTELQNRKKLAAEAGYEPGSAGYKAIIVSGEDPSIAGSSLSDTSLDIKARQIIGGDLSGLTNIGKGAQGSATLTAIHNRAAEILQKEQGLSPQDAASHLSDKLKTFKAETIYGNTEARTGASREANLNLILKATDAAIPAALDASDKVNRVGWVPLDRIIQKGQVATSDPNLARYAMANLQLAEHWARAMNPTGVMRESDRDLALGMLSTATSKETYKAAVDQLRTQITRERDAVKGTGGHPGGAAAPGGAKPDPLGLR